MALTFVGLVNIVQISVLHSIGQTLTIFDFVILISSSVQDCCIQAKELQTMTKRVLAIIVADGVAMPSQSTHVYIMMAGASTCFKGGLGTQRNFVMISCF